MQRVSWLLLFILLDVLGAATAETPVKIGVSLPLTGEAAIYGNDIRRVLEFANTALAGGKYQLLFEDDKCSGKEAVSAAQKLVNMEHVRYMLGYACSGALLSAAPLLERAQVVTVGMFTSADAVSQAGDYIFRSSPEDRTAARVLHRHIAARHSDLALLTEETEYAQQMARMFGEEAAGSGLRLAAETFLPGTADLRTPLLKLKARSPAALFLNTQTEVGLANAVRQVRALQWKVPLFAAYYPSSPNFLSTLGDQAEGIVFVDPPFNVLTEDLSPRGVELYRRFKEQYGDLESIEWGFVLIMNAFQALHEAIASGKPVKEFLYAAEFDGVAGKFAFNANGDAKGMIHVMKEIRGGKVRLLTEGKH